MSLLLRRIATPLLGMGALLAVTGWSYDVAACSPPRPGWHASLQSAVVPSNGYVIVQFYCSVSCAAALPTFTIRDATLAEVAGEVSLVPDVDVKYSMNTVRWRATSPLTAGQYQIDVPSSSDADTLTFETVPAAAVDPMGLKVTRSIGIAEDSAGEEICCPGGPYDSCGGDYCFTRDVRRTAIAVLDWSVEPEAAYWAQYLSRVTWEGADEPAPWRLGLVASETFETQRSEYCYTLELRSMIDGSTATVERACLAHPAGEDLGVAGRPPEVINGYLGMCDEPPSGLDGAWCEARSERCTSYAIDCPNLEQLCPATSAGGACSVSAATTRPQNALVWILTLLTVGLVSRRKKHRAWIG